MRRNARLWKFWTWEIVLAVTLVALGAGAYFYRPDMAPVVLAQPLEIQVLAGVLALIVVTAMAYRLATGTLAGVVKWFVRLLGSGLVVSVLILLPLVLFRYLRQPDAVDPLSPFVALFALWCLYGIVFLIRWQTRLFYRLTNQYEKEE